MFSKSDFKVGMQVYFGRPNGQKTLAEITKLNPLRAKVKTLEVRGSQAEAGKPWSVPYSLLTPADSNAKPIPQEPKQKEPLKYSPFSQDNLILESILNCYSGLSPECLSCDGEASMTYIRQRQSELTRKLKGLFIALGRNVDEGEIYEWDEQRRQTV